LLHGKKQTIIYYNLTKTELKHLYQRFRYLPVNRIYDILQNIRYNIKFEILKHLSDFCYQYQIYGPLLQRFKIKLNRNYKFNHMIIINIIYIESNKVILHVINKAISY
jgi:hypothetical protein